MLTMARAQHSPIDLSPRFSHAGQAAVMPNRIIKESINESVGLAAASPFAQDLFKRLITYADDYGRFNSNPEIMRARLYSLELDAVTIFDVEWGLIELVGVGKVKLYEAARPGVFGYFPRWEEHQRVRNTRARCPDPDSENINDWALKRFVPVALKRKIFERDKFRCGECSASYRMAGVPTAEAVRALSSVLHIDHIVPVTEGGRATEENLRLLCRKCNLGRPKRFDWSSGVEVPKSDLPRLAAIRGETRPESNPNPNPIQSESNNSSPAEREPAVAAPQPASTWGKPEQLVELYNRLIPDGHPQVTRLSPARRRKAAEYLRSFPEQSFWVRVFTEIRHSSFLRSGSQKSPNFRGDFDWLLTKGQDKTENAVKVAEGKYRDREEALV